MITGIWRLKLSATSWASLKLRGVTRWTCTLRPAAVALDGAQDAGARRRAGGLVGEDVVDLVAAPAAVEAR